MARNSIGENMKKTTLLVMLVSIVGKVFGFLREALIVKFFADRAVTDAFQVAYTIPNAILSVVAAALVTGIVPMITKIGQKQGEEEVNKFTSNVLNIFSLICVVLTVFILLVPELFISLFANLENAGNALDYAIPFVRVIAFGMASISIVQLGMGYLNVKQNFLIPAGISIPSNTIIIIVMMLSSRLNQPMLLAYGQLIAMALQAFVIYFYMRKAGFKQDFSIDLKDENLRIMIGLALPLVLGSLMGQFNDIIMKREATSIYEAAGAYTYMNSSAKLIGFVSGIFITSILNVTYPTISRNVVMGDTISVKKSINEAILMLMVFVLPAIVGFVTLAEGIVSVAYGGFGIAEVAVVVPIFIAQTFNLIGVAIRELFTRVQYAYSDMKSSVFVVFLISLGFVISIKPLALLGSRFGMPLAGLAVSFSVFSILGIIPMYLATKKHVGKIPLGIIKKDLLKIVISSLLMGVVVLLLKNSVASLLGLKLGTLVTIVIGGIVYLAGLILFRTQFVLKLLYSIVNKR